MPLSLQFFAGKEAKYIQDVTRRFHLSASDLAYMHGQLEKIISENDLAMRVRREYVEAIIDTHFKNQMETGTSQGANAPDTRARLSAAYFGHPYPCFPSGAVTSYQLLLVLAMTCTKEPFL